MIELISRSKAMDLIKKTKGRIFSAEFFKKDGSYRLMVARLGVKKGVSGRGMRFDPFKKGLIPVYEMIQGNHEPDDKHFRMVNINSLISLRIDNKLLVIHE